MTDWTIQSRATGCSGCGTPFRPGEKGHSLIQAEEKETRRRDLCSSCFKALPKETIAFASAAWTFTVPQRLQNKSREEAVHRETAEELLRKLILRKDPADRGVIYVLAILLERNKQFIERLVSVSDTGEKIRRYEHKPTGDFFSIVDPGLGPEDLPAVQQRVIDLLEGRVSTEAPPPVRVKRTYRFFRHRADPVVRIRKDRL